VPALFADFNLDERLLKSIEDTGFTHCTPIQEQALSYTLKGNDLFAQSQTGTGKTAAFLISIFEIIQRSEYQEQAIVLVPTRELAVQIEAEANLLSAHLDYNILSVYGGVSYEKQERALKGHVDLVIGTPGRLIDLSNKNILKLRDFTVAVIDEADRMFDMGFVGDIRKILSRMPSKEIRQTMLFSATLDFSVKRLATEYMHDDATEINIAPETKTVTKINQELYHVGSSDKFKLLLGIIAKHNAPRMIIFSNTKRMCEELSHRLSLNGIKADFLTGDLPQNKRQRIVDKFKKHEIPVLIATDVAARGIHIDDLELVVNYDIPQHSENYVHRIGRTARAGKSGSAVTFACEMFVEYLEPVESFIGMKIPSLVACEDDLVHDESEGKNWKSHQSHGKPRQQERGRRDQKNRNNYQQNKRKHSSGDKAKSKQKARPQQSPKIHTSTTRKAYTGNPVADREELRGNKGERLTLKSENKTQEFNDRDKNPYARPSKKRQPNRNGSSASKKSSKSKSYNSNKSKNSPKKGSVKGTQTQKNTPTKAPQKVGFIKSLFSKK